MKGKGKALARSWSSPGSELLQEQQGHSPSAALLQFSSVHAAVSPSGKIDGESHKSLGRAMRYQLYDFHCRPTVAVNVN